MPAVESSWLVGSASSGGTFVFDSDEATGKMAYADGT